MALDEAEEIIDAVAEDLITGIQETIVDGTTVRTMDPLRRVQALQALQEEQAAVDLLVANKWFGMRFLKFIPPGTG